MLDHPPGESFYFPISNCQDALAVQKGMEDARWLGSEVLPFSPCVQAADSDWVCRTCVFVLRLSQSSCMDNRGQWGLQEPSLDFHFLPDPDTFYLNMGGLFWILWAGRAMGTLILGCLCCCTGVERGGGAARAPMLQQGLPMQ